MRTDVESDMRWAVKMFHSSVWPAIREGWFGSSASLIHVEEAQGVTLARLLDTKAGIDALVETKNGLIAVAVRVQEDPGYRTFTIRKARSSGVETEYRKRMMAIQRDCFMYPSRTVQAYVRGCALSAAAIVRTRDLFLFIRNDPAVWVNRRSNDDGTWQEFFCCSWSDMQEAGLDLRIYEAP